MKREERERLEALPSRTAEQQARLAALQATAAADAQAEADNHARKGGYSQEEIDSGHVGQSARTLQRRADPEKAAAQKSEENRRRKLTPQQKLAEAEEALRNASTDVERRRLKGVVFKAKKALG